MLRAPPQRRISVPVLLLLVELVLVGPSCVRLLESSPDSRESDSASPRDSGAFPERVGDAPHDIAHDSSLSDTGAGDTGASDTGSGDTVADDVGAAPDLLQSDTGSDTGSVPAPPPCAGGASPTLTYAVDMQLCWLTGGSVDQCSAESLCNASYGWRLCTATEFKARGGTTVLSSKSAWLKSCIRDGDATFAPSDSLCTCSTATGLTATYAWNCAGGAFVGGSALHIGVTTYGQCRRIGVNDAANEANWMASPAYNAGSGAMCCWSTP